MINGQEFSFPSQVFLDFHGGEIHVQSNGQEAVFLDGLARLRGTGTDADPNSVSAPMDGILTKVLARKGESVARGQTLAVLEAMKIQLELKSPRDGVVADVLAQTSSQVRNRQILVKLE